MIIVLYILYCVYPYFSGKKDAVLWSGQSYNSVPYDIHKWIFTPERLCFGASIVLSCVGLKHNWFTLDKPLVALGMMVLSFPFFHNGAYYVTRGKIDGTYSSWMDHSKTHKGLNFSPPARLLMFLCSFIYLLCHEYYF